LLVNSENLTRVKVANKIASQLKTIGMNVTVKTTGWETEKSLVKYKNYDMAVLGWEISPVPDVSFAYSSKEITSGLNVSGYNNPVVDDYLNKILIETNKNKKKTLYSDMLSVINNDMPYVGLYFYNDGVLYSRRVFGDLSPCSWNRLNDLPYWYLNVSENR
jgi:peptide/nickel transport system substrate-binding protein